MTHVSAPAGQVGWRYEKPTEQGKMFLLTIGKVAVVGNWTGTYGQYYVAWSPMPARDKDIERALGV